MKTRINPPFPKAQQKNPKPKQNFLNFGAITSLPEKNHLNKTSKEQNVENNNTHSFLSYKAQQKYVFPVFNRYQAQKQSKRQNSVFKNILMG